MVRFCALLFSNDKGHWATTPLPHHITLPTPLPLVDLSHDSYNFSVSRLSCMTVKTHLLSHKEQAMMTDATMNDAMIFCASVDVQKLSEKLLRVNCREWKKGEYR